MNKRLYFLTALLVLLVSSATGCKKKTSDEAGGAATAAPGAAAPAAKSTESEAIMAALDKKDYDAVVSGLAAMKQSATTAEQLTRFEGLVDDVKIRLLEEAPSNPKAAESLAVLRRLTGGR